MLTILFQAKDSTTVEIVACLMESTDPASDSLDPQTQVTRLCSKVISVTTVFENYRSTKKGRHASHHLHVTRSQTHMSEVIDTGVIDQARRIIVILPALSRLRVQAITPDVRLKIDKSLERLRRSVTMCIKGDRRVEELITKEGATCVAPSAINTILLDLLDGVAKHAEYIHQSPSDQVRGLRVRFFPRHDVADMHISILQQFSSDDRKDLLASAIDSLLLLAYFHLAVDDRLSYSAVFDYLDRCLPLIGITSDSVSLAMTVQAKQAIHPVRSLTSAFYNIGGTLYNASRPQSGIRFLQRSCDVGDAVLRYEQSTASLSERSSSDLESLAEIRRHMPKRWELLALSYHGIGEKRVCSHVISGESLTLF